MTGTTTEKKVPVLRASHLGISFGGLKAVDDFNMEIGQSELVGLIGPNGAGKTTVFNLLTGVYQPTEGAYYLNGTKMNGKKTHQVVEAGIARTFQNIRLFKKMTVLENVEVAMNKDMKYSLAASIFRTGSYWKEEKEIEQKAMELLEIVKLDQKASYVAENLPYGEQRRLEIARALATGMKLLLLDEPAAGMNPVETEQLLEIINRIRDEFKISVLLIEHDMSLVMKICERIQVIDYGVTIAEGTPAEIASNPKVIEAYLGKDDEKDQAAGQAMTDETGTVSGAEEGETGASTEAGKVVTGAATGADQNSIAAQADRIVREASSDAGQEEAVIEEAVHSSEGGTN